MQWHGGIYCHLWTGLGCVVIGRWQVCRWSDGPTLILCLVLRRIGHCGVFYISWTSVTSNSTALTLTKMEDYWDDHLLWPHLSWCLNREYLPTRRLAFPSLPCPSSLQSRRLQQSLMFHNMSSLDVYEDNPHTQALREHSHVLRKQWRLESHCNL